MGLKAMEGERSGVPISLTSSVPSPPPLTTQNQISDTAVLLNNNATAVTGGNCIVSLTTSNSPDAPNMGSGVDSPMRMLSVVDPTTISTASVVPFAANTHAEIIVASAAAPTTAIPMATAGTTATMRASTTTVAATAEISGKTDTDIDDVSATVSAMPVAGEAALGGTLSAAVTSVSGAETSAVQPISGNPLRSVSDAPATGTVPTFYMNGKSAHPKHTTEATVALSTSLPAATTNGITMATPTSTGTATVKTATTASPPSKSSSLYPVHGTKQQGQQNTHELRYTEQQQLPHGLQLATLQQQMRELRQQMLQQNQKESYHYRRLLQQQQLLLQQQQLQRQQQQLQQPQSSQQQSPQQLQEHQRKIERELLLQQQQILMQQQRQHQQQLLRLFRSDSNACSRNEMGAWPRSTPGAPGSSDGAPAVTYGTTQFTRLNTISGSSTPGIFPHTHASSSSPTVDGPSAPKLPSPSSLDAGLSLRAARATTAAAGLSSSSTESVVRSVQASPLTPVTSTSCKSESDASVMQSRANNVSLPQLLYNTRMYWGPDAAAAVAAAAATASSPLSSGSKYIPPLYPHLSGVHTPQFTASELAAVAAFRSRTLAACPATFGTNVHSSSPVAAAASSSASILAAAAVTASNSVRDATLGKESEAIQKMNAVASTCGAAAEDGKGGKALMTTATAATASAVEALSEYSKTAPTTSVASSAAVTGAEVDGEASSKMPVSTSSSSSLSSASSYKDTLSSASTPSSSSASEKLGSVGTAIGKDDGGVKAGEDTGEINGGGLRCGMANNTTAAAVDKASLWYVSKYGTAGGGGCPQVRMPRDYGSVLSALKQFEKLCGDRRKRVREAIANDKKEVIGDLSRFNIPFATVAAVDIYSQEDFDNLMKKRKLLHNHDNNSSSSSNGSRTSNNKRNRNDNSNDSVKNRDDKTGGLLGQNGNQQVELQQQKCLQQHNEQQEDHSRQHEDDMVRDKIEQEEKQQQLEREPLNRVEASNIKEQQHLHEEQKREQHLEQRDQQLHADESVGGQGGQEQQKEGNEEQQNRERAQQTQQKQGESQEQQQREISRQPRHEQSEQRSMMQEEPQLQKQQQLELQEKWRLKQQDGVVDDRGEVAQVCEGGSVKMEVNEGGSIDSHWDSNKNAGEKQQIKTDVDTNLTNESKRKNMEANDSTNNNITNNNVTNNDISSNTINTTISSGSDENQHFCVPSKMRRIHFYSLKEVIANLMPYHAYYINPKDIKINTEDQSTIDRRRRRIDSVIATGRKLCARIRNPIAAAADEEKPNDVLDYLTSRAAADAVLTSIRGLRAEPPAPPRPVSVVSRPLGGGGSGVGAGKVWTAGASNAGGTKKGEGSLVAGGSAGHSPTSRASSVDFASSDGESASLSPSHNPINRENRTNVRPLPSPIPPNSHTAARPTAIHFGGPTSTSNPPVRPTAIHFGGTRPLSHHPARPTAIHFGGAKSPSHPPARPTAIHFGGTSSPSHPPARPTAIRFGGTTSPSHPPARPTAIRFGGTTWRPPDQTKGN